MGASKIHIGSAITENYLPKTFHLLQSLSVLESERFCVTYGFHADESLKRRFPHVRFYSLGLDQVRSPNVNGCIQHGAFLTALPVGEEDVIIMVDGDVIVQRDLHQHERKRFSLYGDDIIGVGWNDGPYDTLDGEFNRIGPLVTKSDLAREFPGWERPVYNTGVLVARPVAWHRFCSLYDQYWDALKDAFAHYAKNQWLMSWILNQWFKVNPLGYEFHTHGHYPLTASFTYKEGKLLYKEKTILFRHAFFADRVLERFGPGMTERERQAVFERGF